MVYNLLLVFNKKKKKIYCFYWTKTKTKLIMFLQTHTRTDHWLKTFKLCYTLQHNGSKRLHGCSNKLMHLTTSQWFAANRNCDDVAVCCCFYCCCVAKIALCDLISNSTIGVICVVCLCVSVTFVLSFLLVFFISLVFIVIIGNPFEIKNWNWNNKNWFDLFV